MGIEEQGAERALPDLPERIDLAVGHLTVMAQSLRTGRPLLVKDADALEAAMLLLAGLQGVVAWEPAEYRFEPRAIAGQLHAMAAVWPRPPAVVKLLTDAAGHLDVAAAARAEQDQVAAEEAAGNLGDVMLEAERRARDIAEQALQLGRVLARVTDRVTPF